MATEIGTMEQIMNPKNRMAVVLIPQNGYTEVTFGRVYDDEFMPTHRFDTKTYKTKKGLDKAISNWMEG